MNRSSMIETLESRELFSAYTLQECMVSSFRAPAPTTAPYVAHATAGANQQPQSFSWGANQTVTGFQWGVGRG
jgi:hypothetical protein